MIQIGSRIDTSITLSVVRDGQEETLPLSALLSRPAIVSVYMKNNTSSCDIQTCELQSIAAEFEAKGIQLIALSKDTCGSHRRYAEKHGFTLILASDPDDLFSKAADSIVEKSMYGKSYLAPSRSAFHLDTDGTVLGVIEKVEPKRHAEQLKSLVS
jgi:peroxiredoxin Q/BCP